MAIKIGMIKNKGGTGATTILNCLAGELAFKHNKRVLLIDTDQQNNLKTLYKLTTSSAEGGYAAVITEGVSPLSLKYEVRPNISLLPSGGRFVREIEANYSHTPNAEMLMQNRFREVESEFDFVLCDVAPSITLTTSMILCYCDWAISATSLDLLGLVGTKNILQFYELTKKHFDVAEMLAIIPSLADFRRRVDVDLYEDLKSLAANDLTQGAIITTPFRMDSKIRTSQVRRKLIQEAFPDSKAATDISAIATELLNEIERRNKTKTANIIKPQIEAAL